jgi:DDE family transposase
MQEKWQVRKKKGYLKIHIVVNTKTKEILALEVTDEKVHDGRKIMPKLVEYIMKRSNNNIKIKSTLGDGSSYDSNENFKYLQKKRIRSGIRARKYSIILLKNNSLRNIEVYSQSKDLLKWKKSRKYGSRGGLL